ncbi:hypothetical protein SmJEL517_g03241 [Synchytrium microbalum]|uniref:Nitrate/nitrite transporter n=1 Tax=Synchytrium microbalum TaxID=1806994 RepID=A0A507C2P2_9FUNG|nr:uncharacterized protein SmJEL517_g03241 [Synchytrium microbalum]TPX34002.1 hypothetical protein SmJEL517_g03241 [Synchytrium microbalum]
MSEVIQEKPTRACPNLFPKELIIDEVDGKATNIKLNSLRRPHMRSFHLSWLGFFSAFTTWFALNPLLKKTIAPLIGITAGDVANSDIANVSSTVIARFFIGGLVDKFGPSRAMAFILMAGSLPIGLVGLVNSAGGLIVLRLFVGIIGSTFVPCQYWTTALFSKNIVGTANAIAGGWGNMGGGFTFLIMPQVFNLMKTIGLSVGNAWKVTYVFPVIICWIVAILCLRFGDDHPVIKTLPVAAETEILKDKPEEGATAVIDTIAAPTHILGGAAEKVPYWKIMLRAVTNPYVIILMFSYACCFGVELSVDSQIANYFIGKYALDQTTAGQLSSIFGLMNFFSRASGGLLSDLMFHYFGMRGRIGISATFFFINGIALIGFSFADTLGASIGSMVVFSYFTQALCGTTFGIVPFVDSGIMGAVTGLVGAGGNIGGAIFNSIFTAYVTNLSGGFRVMGIIVLVCGFLPTFALRVQGSMLLFKTK